MKEVTTVILENEMDLILANKQSMKLAEFAGLSISGQTTFATAVSEVLRTAIERSAHALLTLCLADKSDTGKQIIAIIRDVPGAITDRQREGFANARRLISNMQVRTSDSETLIELRYSLPDTVRIDDKMIEKVRILLNSDPHVSPYEEIKRKNRQLQELSDMLAQSEHRYRDMTDSLPLLIYTIDPQGRLLYANKWLLDYTGKSIDELNDTRWGDTLPEGERDAIWERFFTDAATRKNVPRQRMLRNAADNTYRWHSGIATPVLATDGDVAYWHVFMADIHAQKMVEETLKDNQELKETKAMLEQKVTELNNSNRELEQFAYVASHDLQEPLRKINFYTDMLRSRYNAALPDDAAPVLDNIIRSAERMKTLVHDILAYSTVDAQADMSSTLDLNTLVQDVLVDLDLGIREKRAEVSVAPLPTVAGNAVQIRQLFANLLSNAIKYTRPDTPLAISVFATADDRMEHISVQDNGIGFDTAYLEKMFHLFQRLHSRDKYSGTGIGLAICKKIAQMHCGDISAKSVPNKGSTFTVSLPKLQRQE